MGEMGQNKLPIITTVFLLWPTRNQNMKSSQKSNFLPLRISEDANNTTNYEDMLEVAVAVVVETIDAVWETSIESTPIGWFSQGKTFPGNLINQTGKFYDGESYQA